MLAETLLELTYKIRDAIQAGALEEAQALTQERMGYLQALSKAGYTHGIAQKLAEADAALMETASIERERLRSALLSGPIALRGDSFRPTAQFLDKAA